MIRMLFWLTTKYYTVLLVGCMLQLTVALTLPKQMSHTPVILEGKNNEAEDESSKNSLGILPNDDTTKSDANYEQFIGKVITNMNSDREKRVFLSRGWGPGGYEAPPPPPQRSVRRPPPPPQLSRQRFKSQLSQQRDFSDGARFEALVSSNQQQQQKFQKPQYRRFHSIFTSGTWSPLGKRSDRLMASKQFEDSAESTDHEAANTANVKNGLSVTASIKRSAVFSSHGWGAGGSSTPFFVQPWITSVSHNLKSRVYPQIRRSGIGRTGDGRNLANFRSNGLTQDTKPLSHFFVSHGWGPMGR